MSVDNVRRWNRNPVYSRNNDRVSDKGRTQVENKADKNAKGKQGTTDPAKTARNQANQRDSFESARGEPTKKTAVAQTPAKPSPLADGFERQGNSVDRRQQKDLLGSSTTDTASQAPVGTQAGALEKLGLTSTDVVTADKNAAPQLEKAAQAAAEADYVQALDSLKGAATSAPEVAQKAVLGMGATLPDGPAKTLLTDKTLSQELLTNEQLHSSLGKLIENPADIGAVRELINNDKVRDATLTAIGSDAGVTSQLAKVGLTPQDLVQAGKAAPKLWDAFDKFSAGDVKGGLTDFQAAVTAAPDLAGKMGQKVLDAVPPQIKNQFTKLGITPDAIQKAGPALPELYGAADAAAKGDWKGAYTSLKNAAASAPELATQALKGLATQLPNQMGVAKSLLTNDGFLKELVSNKEMQGSLEKLVGGDASGVRELLNNDAARDATLTAVGSDPAVSSQLAKVGLTPQDLVQAGKAAPKLWDAFDKFSAGDVKGGLTDFQAAITAAPDLAGKMGQKLVDRAPQSIKNQFTKLGITPDALQKAGPALPELYGAADAAAKGDWKGAYTSLKNAAAAAPELATQALKGLATQLPNQMGVMKTMLTNDAVLKELVSNKELQGSLEKLAGGDASGLRELLNNDTARDAALGALGTDKTVQAKLQKIGLEPADLVEAGKAAPKLLDAFDQFAAGQVKEGLLSVQAAVEAAPGMAAKLGQKVVDALPAQVKQQFSKLGISEQALRTAGPALTHLYGAVESVSKGDWAGALSATREAAIAAPDLATQALKGLANQLPEKMGIAKRMLTNDAFLKELVTNKDLHEQVGKLFNDATRMEGVRGLLGNDTFRDATINAIAGDPGVRATLDKVGLTTGDLLEAGKASPHLLDAMQAFSEGKIDAGAEALAQAATAAPTLLNKLGDKVLSKLPTGVRTAINNLGLTPAELTQAATALPDLIKAGQAAFTGDMQGALLNLKNAAGKVPPTIVEKAITTFASKLPATGFSGMARSMLTDPAFVKELVNNKELHASFDKMMKGDFLAGLKGMFSNETVRKAAGNALATNTELMAKLKPFGIQTGADISDIGGAAIDVLEAAGKLAQSPPDVKGVMGSLSSAVTGLSPELRARMVGAFADNLKLPEYAKGMLVATAGLIGNAEVGRSLGDAFDALGRGDVAAFTSGLAATGRKIAETAPDVAKAFLNSMSKIPGSAGKLFTDETLNAAIVDSGSAGKIFGALEKMGKGDMAGAVNELTSAAGALMGEGDHFDILGNKLPFGAKGLDNFGRLFGRFMDALPDKTKARLTEAIAKSAAKAGLQSVPVLGNIASVFMAIDSGIKLGETIKNNPQDTAGIALASVQLGLDIASIVPGVNSFLGPLKVGLGVANAVKGLVDIGTSVSEFQKGLVTLS